MGKILVLFASKSDKVVYDRIVKTLKKNNANFELRIASAHKSPDDVDEIINALKYDVVVSGAGLSAALPGVIASKTLKPVIGVPVNSNYQGLDSLLTIAQMPPGIPVLAVGVDKAEIAATSAMRFLKNYSTVTIISDDKDNIAVKKAVELLNEFGVVFDFGDKPKNDSLNLEFAYFDEPMEDNEALIIYCPLVLDYENSAESSLNFLKHTSHGLWVGLNNGVNAALACVEILNMNDKFTRKLIRYRKTMREKLKADDNTIKR